MGERRQARELALQALFSMDMDPEGSVGDLDEFCADQKEWLSDGVRPFFEDLVRGVMENKDRIDALLEKYSKNWKISRMPAVDRNIMRIAVFEFIAKDDIPTNVTINEAVEIGKKFGTRDSGPFINGVLDRIKSLESLSD